ncbi:AIPR family protein [Streptomyces sp. KR80]|uniref:AIPR family protein n=1 Tax=Streptomyces sp. KR80 TaxID=3457426 RepID=UPI003FD1CDBB
MAPKNNDQRLLDRILEDKRLRLAPNLRLEDFFNYFAADNALQDLDLDTDELRDGIVDGSHDCGVDGIWVLVDGRYVTADWRPRIGGRAPEIDLVILQAKTAPGYQESAFEKLHYHLPLLLNMGRDIGKLSESTNAKLLDRTGRFLRVLEELASSFPKIRIKVIYATKSAEPPHPNVRAKGNRLARELESIASGTRCKIEYLGAAELRELAARGATVVGELVFTETPMSTSLGEAYVCLVRLDEYCKFLSAPNDALRLELFESNVRDYAGRTAVNSAIRETLNSTSKDDFWWFNNGVTIVASEARITGKKIVMKDPQIVNGLQTSHLIYSHFQQSEQHRDRSLLVKIVVPPGSSTRDGIIRATNSQTQLPPGALRATEKIQKDIEESLARVGGFYYERRANYYKNLGFELEQIVSMARLAQEFTAFALGEPHSALKFSESLLMQDAHYEKIFSTDRDLDLYRIVLQVHREIGNFLTSYMDYNTLLGDTAENWRYHLAYMASFTLTKKRSPSEREFLAIDTNSFSEDLIEQMVLILDREYRAALRSNKTKGIDRIARSSDFTHRVRQATLNTRRFKIER